MGSSSLFETLRHEFPFHDVKKSHYISKYFIKEYFPKYGDQYQEHIALGEKIQHDLNKHPNKTIKIFTLVREPIARDLSDMFQVPHYYFGDTDIREVSNQMIVENIKKRAFKHYLTWFDQEFKQFTGIDIFDHPFDQKKGYTIIKQGKFEVLALKLEQLNDCFNPALNEFMNINVNNLIQANSTDNKKSSDKYKSLKQDIHFDKEILSELYNSKMIRHFYSNQEIEQFISKWS